MFNKRLIAVIITLMILSLVGAPVATAHTQVNADAIQSPDQGRGDSVHVTAKFLLSGITVEELYAFVSNLENDHLWYLGTYSSVLISGDGGRGSVYEEVVNFGTGFVTIQATVEHLVENRHVRFRSDGIFINETQYHMKTLNDGRVEFIIDSFVQIPAGFDPSFLTDLYLPGLYYQLHGALGLNPAAGELIIPAHGNQQL